MTEVTEENIRIREQVTSLSTQLIESMDRQSQLEDKLRQANKLIQSQATSVSTLEAVQNEHSSLKEKMTEKDATIESLQDELKSENKLRIDAESEVEKLSQEVEDLTASLFAEANNMVADARKEKHTTEILNTKLVERLRDKDNMLETLTIQLKNLKKVLQDAEKESISNQSSRYSTVLNDSETISGRSLNRVNTSNSSIMKDPDNVIMYSPYVTTIRYDLTLFNEFLKFIAVLPYCKSIRESASESKLLRRLINDEVQTVLRIDNAPGIGWLAKKSLMQQMVDGLVVLEPLSGVNETYQIGYRSASGSTPQSIKNDTSNSESHMFNYPANSPPVAVHGPCALCGESRDDIIEHARMHVLKVQSRGDDGKLTVTSTYSLCYCCVNKVRQTGQIFAFLRSLKLGTWHLEKVTLKTIEKGDWSKVNNSAPIATRRPAPLDKKSKRKSFMEGLGIAANKVTPEVETSNSVVERAGFPTTNIQRAWLHLCQLRSMLFWTHVGIWSTDDSIASKIGPVIKSKDDSIETQTPIDINEWKHSRSEESLTSTKNSNDEKDDMFDFESKSDLGREEHSTDVEEQPVDENAETNKDVTLTEESKEETATKMTIEQTEEDTKKKESSPKILHQSLDPKSDETQEEKKAGVHDSEEDISENAAIADTTDNEIVIESETPKIDSANDNSDVNSIDILNDYTEQEELKETSTSPSNEDEFDDAQEHI